jgi:hypothetical protein
MNPIEWVGWGPPVGLGLVGGPDEGAPVGDGVLVPPLQATPLRAKAVGAGLLPVHEPLNPKLVLPLVAKVPFQLALRAVTCAPLWETVAFQA